MDYNYDDALTCPYNPAHVFLRGRTQGHLMKCRAQYEQTKGKMGSATCGFNSTHVVPDKELEIHELLCEDRRNADQLMFAEDSTYEIGPISSHSIVIPPCEENWDNDTTEFSVLDMIKERAKSKPVLLTCHGVPPAERKRHRMEEKIRHRELKENK